jgi:hypothetical protein
MAGAQEATAPGFIHLLNELADQEETFITHISESIEAHVEKSELMQTLKRNARSHALQAIANYTNGEIETLNQYHQSGKHPSLTVDESINVIQEGFDSAIDGDRDVFSILAQVYPTK